MALAEVTYDAVLAAIAEFDKLGQAAFLQKYGFAEATKYWLAISERRYDSKAICGAAHGYARPQAGPLRPADFSGGADTVARRLRDLGFEIVTHRQRGTKAWLATTLGDDRQYAGNNGYDDVLERAYRYDSSLPNSRQLQVDDLLILRSKTKIVGVARILEVEQMTGVKRLQLCPQCKKSGPKARRTRTPHFRCHHCKKEFDEPLIRNDNVTNFVAHYDGAFRSMDLNATLSELRGACPRYNGQNSMQEIVLALLGPSGQPIKTVADQILASDAVSVSLATAKQPTADPMELARRVQKLLDLGPLLPPVGCDNPKKVPAGPRQLRERDPAVVAWVLQHANGQCQSCKKSAPFKNKKGVWFLEVHHVVMLSDEGRDVIQNAVALCPNCHRAAHFAHDNAVLRSALSATAAGHGHG